MNYTPDSKAAALVARLKEARENISAIKELWAALFGAPIPDDSQVHRWLLRYGFDAVVESIEDLMVWVGKHKQALAIMEESGEIISPENRAEHTKTLTDLIRYVSGIMGYKAREADGDEQRA
jgi:hypothetical protein